MTRALAEHLRAILGGLPGLVVAPTVLAFWAVALARQWGIPAIWCIHESEEPFTHLRRLPAALREELPGLLESAARVVFVSRSTREVFAPYAGRGNFVVIPNALPPDAPVFQARSRNRKLCRENLAIAEGEISFLALGSVFARKGQEDVRHALALLPQDVLGTIRCDLVGDRPGTPYSIRLHTLLSTLPAGARERIRLFPETPDTPAHYAAADVFVFCSRVESYPLVILEAMSLGLPIIATPVFGVREQLEPKDALFYEPGDAKALARHMETLARDKNARAELGRAAAQRYASLPGYGKLMNAYRQYCDEAIAGR